MTKKTSLSGTSGKSGTKTRTGNADPGADHSPSPASVQLKTYERAVSLFSQHKLAEARDVFMEAASGPARNVADKARSYMQVCERRTAGFDLQLHTAEDHFNYGVERLNARDLDRAREHLDRSLKLLPDADYVLYAMSLCCGLCGDGAGAYENLKRAIELEPRNRILARQDPEFVTLASHLPALRELLANS